MLYQHMRSAAFALLLLMVPVALARPAGSHAINVVDANGVAYFTSYDGALWRTDGTEDGTFQVDLGGGTLHNNRSTSMVAIGGKLYLFATDNDTARLRVSDGGHGTEVVFSLDGLAAGHLTATASRLFFLTRSRIAPDCLRLWTSDGTANGTHVIATLFTNDAEPLGAAAEAMLFRIYTGPFEYGARTRYDLWRTNGTSEGTALFDDVVPERMTAAAGVLFYLREKTLWRTDGTAEGTFSIAEDVTSIDLASKDAVVFRQKDEYWRSDGTREGTAQIARVQGDWPHSFNGTHLIGFAGGTTIQSTADGMIQPLAILRLRTDPYHRTFYTHATVGRLVYVYAGTLTRDEIWRTDGTPEGTILLRTFPTGGETTQRPLHVIGDRVLFWANDAVAGSEPWISDGTREGTRMIANLGHEGVLRGRVTDRATGAPIAGALVEIRDRSSTGTTLAATVTTDANGAYEYLGIGEVFVHVTATSEYIPYIPVSGVVLRSDETVTADIALQRGGHFAGRVTDRSGMPLAGVTVNFVNVPFAPYRAAFAVKTDADGRYVSPALLPGQGWLLYTSGHPGYSGMMHGGVSCAVGCENVIAQPQLITGTDETSTVDFSLPRSGKLTFRVLDADTGEPIEGPITVTAYLDSWRLPRPAAATVTFRGGEPNEMTLPDGRHWVLALPEDRTYGGMWFPASPCSFDCSDGPRGTFVLAIPGETKTVTFQLRRLGAVLGGRVVDAHTGAGLAAVDVQVVDKAGVVAASAVTGPDGAYRTALPLLHANVQYRIRTVATHTHVAELYDGANGIICRGACNDPGAATITLGDREVRGGIDFRLDRAGSISGTIVDAVTGATIPPSVYVRDSTGYAKSASYNGDTFVVGGLYSATYTVRGVPPVNWNAPPPQTVQVELGANVPVTLTAQPSCTVTLGASAAALPTAGGVGAVAFTSDCSYATTFYGAAPEWISIAQEKNELRYIVQPNHGPARAHTFVGPGVVFTIRQEAGW